MKAIFCGNFHANFYEKKTSFFLSSFILIQSTEGYYMQNTLIRKKTDERSKGTCAPLYYYIRLILNAICMFVLLCNKESASIKRARKKNL